MANTYNVNIAGMQFVPASQAIKSGDTVVWTNSMPVIHTVVADDGSFQSGNLAKNATFSHTFSGPAATIGYHCSIHPGMKGTINLT